jgi:hypothetical protein
MGYSLADLARRKTNKLDYLESMSLPLSAGAIGFKLKETVILRI